jgi:hypothetical protein
VRYLTTEAWIRQFLDIGTGIPAAGSTHQVAQAIAPETRVAYAEFRSTTRVLPRGVIAARQGRQVP